MFNTSVQFKVMYVTEFNSLKATIDINNSKQAWEVILTAFTLGLFYTTQQKDGVEIFQTTTNW